MNRTALFPNVTVAALLMPARHDLFPGTGFVANDRRFVVLQYGTDSADEMDAEIQMSFVHHAHGDATRGW